MDNAEFTIIDEYFNKNKSVSDIEEKMDEVVDQRQNMVRFDPRISNIILPNDHKAAVVKSTIDDFQSIFEDRKLFRAPKKISPSMDRSSIREFIDNGLYSICIETTKRCNLRCDYCTWKDEHNVTKAFSNIDMCYEDAIKAVDYLIEHSSKRIEMARKYNYSSHVFAGIFKPPYKLNVSFYGGEPLLRFPLIEQVVSYCREIEKSGGPEFDFKMTTNFVHVSEEQLEYLVENDFNLLISLDGPEEIHDRYRRTVNGQGTYQSVIKNVDAYRQKSIDMNKRGFCLFNCVLAPPIQYKRIIEFFKELTDKYGDNCLRSACSDVPGFCPQQESMDLKKENNEMQRMLIDEGLKWLSDQEGDSLSIESNRLIVSMMSSFMNRNISPKGFCDHCGGSHSGPCFPGSRAYLSVDRKYYPCERVSQNEKFVIGDVDEGLSVEKIHDMVMKEHKLVKHKCIDCWAIKNCSLCYKILESDDIDQECQDCTERAESEIMFALEVSEKFKINMEKLY